MRDQPLPPELAHYGNLQHLQYHTNDEWSAECVHCGTSNHDWSTGEPDRLRLFGKNNKPGVNARVWCRSCGFFEFADAGAEDYTSPSPEAIAAAQAERERLARQELERTKAKMREIQASPAWRQYHDQMTEEQRRYWLGRGVCEYMQDYYSLGYRTDYTLVWDGQQWVTPALTIPHYGDEWQLTNIQYRLQQPPPGAGKYRQTSGLPAAMFRTEPEEALKGAILVVEGAIKSIILYQHLGGSPLGFPLTIVGIPSKMPSTGMLSQLADAEPIYLLLDPDAYADGSVNRVAGKLGNERVRVAKTPVKPDDLITVYGGDSDDIRRALQRARRA